MILGLVLIVSLLAVAYAAFTTGVMCAGNRQLRLVFVRVVALLGLVALGGACVSVLSAESPNPNDEISTDASIEQAAEIVVEAFGEIDEGFVNRYADLDQYMAVDEVALEPAADEIVVEVVPVLEDKIEDVVEPVVFGCQGLEHIEFVDNGGVTALPVSISIEEPKWVGQTSFVVDGPFHWTAVEGGPWLTDVEAETALNEAIFQAVADYVDDQVGRRGAARRIHISLNDIEAYQIVRERYADEYESSVGSSMPRKHAKLVFTPDFRSLIVTRWQEHLVAHRLVKTAIGIAAVMALLFMSLGLFKRLGSSVR